MESLYLILAFLLLPCFLVPLGLVGVLAEPGARTYAQDLALFTRLAAGLFAGWVVLAALAWRGRRRTLDLSERARWTEVFPISLRFLAMGAPLAALAGSIAGFVLSR